MKRLEEKNFAAKIEETAGSKIISINSDSEYIVGNIVHKRGTKRYFIHFVNYNNPVSNVKVKVDFQNIVTSLKENSIKVSTPDKINSEIKQVKFNGDKVEFTMSELAIYNIVELIAK